MGVRSPEAPHTSRPARPPLAARAGNAIDAREEDRPRRPDRDMRSKRPPALSFLLRMDTARRLMRVVSLLALDLLGLASAIFTALILKAAVLSSEVSASGAFTETRRILAFAYLLTAL